MNQDREDVGARLEAYLAGAMNADERAAFEAEALADEELADRLYAAESLNAAVGNTTRGVAAPARVVRPPVSAWRRRAWLAALPVAAVLTFMLLVPQDRFDGAPAPVLRGEERVTEGLQPRGDLAAAPDRFVWTATTGAARYRLELFDGAGRLLLVRVVSDTMLVVDPAGPATLMFVPGDEPYWQVTPIEASGRELPVSSPVRFRLP